MTILSSDIVGLSSDYRRIVFLLAEAIQGVLRCKCWPSRISWQAQYLVRLEGDFDLLRALEMTFHMCRRSLDDIHFAWQAQHLVRLEGWLYLLRALEMTFHMWHRSLMTFILHGRCSIWWGCRVTLPGSAHWKWRFICDADHQWPWSFCVAGAVFGEVGGWLL